MKEYDVRLQVMASDLTSTEKIVMLAILLKVDWKSFTGQVAISQLVSLTNIKKRTVQRAIKKLIEIKWITRTSKHIEKEVSTIAQTTVLVSNIKGVSPMTLDDTHDTKGVSPMTLGGDTHDTFESDTDDIHTISNNINSITNNIEEPEPHGDMEVDQVCIEGGGIDDFWIYPSSIQDPVVRRQTELYIQSRPKMLESDKQRLLFPQAATPFWK